jgi:hypothetical protein
MTLDTLKSNARKYHRCEIIAGFIIFLGPLLAIIPFSFLEDRVGRTGFDSTCIAVLAITFPAITALMFYGVVGFPRRSLKKHNLVCPACGKPLIGRRGLHPVITTGCCSICGEKVIN